jgi:hypothetical protein
LRASPVFVARWQNYNVWTVAAHEGQVAWFPDVSHPATPFSDLSISYFAVVGGEDRVLVVMTTRRVADETVPS